MERAHPDTHSVWTTLCFLWTGPCEAGRAGQGQMDRSLRMARAAAPTGALRKERERREAHFRTAQHHWGQCDGRSCAQRHGLLTIPLSTTKPHAGDWPPTPSPQGTLQSLQSHPTGTRGERDLGNPTSKLPRVPAGSHPNQGFLKGKRLLTRPTLLTRSVVLCRPPGKGKQSQGCPCADAWLWESH